MKKTVSILLVLCFCLGFAACGASAKASSTTPSTDSPAASAAPSAPAAPDAPAASAVPAASAAPTANVAAILQSVVDSLNEEELAQRTEEDPSVGVFELGEDENTIVYKLAMDYFQYVIMMAQSDNTESLNAYNRILDILPNMWGSLEKTLSEAYPGLKVKVYLMSDAYSSEVAAVVENGEIVYDVVNGVGTAPKNVKPIIQPEDLPPELQAELDELKNALNGEAPAEGTPAAGTPAAGTPAPAANNG